VIASSSRSALALFQSGAQLISLQDMTEFTKSILPRMFKHSNFASFVRQLNKYDFHKVKNNEENTFGDHSWTFRHPDFQADRRDALENIKRKVPSQRKPASSKAPTNSNPTTGAAAHTGSPVSPPPPSDSNIIQSLQSQIDRLTRAQDDMAAHIRSLESNYQSVLSEMVNFQRNMAQQDGLMQNLIQYFLQLENGCLDYSLTESPN
jgi:osomolarity two-component system, response regulator SKN7